MPVLSLRNSHSGCISSICSALVLLVFSVVSSASAASSCAQIDKLLLQLPRPVQPEYAGFVVPTSETPGAPKFADECLQIQVQGGGRGFDPLQELKDGRADVAVAEGGYVAQKIAAGEALTIIGGYHQRNGLVWIAMNKTQFANPNDLASVLSSRKIGKWCCGYDLSLTAISSKIRPAITNTMIDQDPARMHQLLSGEIDLATAMIYDELAQPLQVLDSSTNNLKLQKDLYTLDPEKSGLTLVHNVVVVQTAKLASLRPKLVRFLKTVTRAWQYCRDNEVACATAFSEYGMASAHHIWQMRAVNQFIFPALSGFGLGVLSQARWDAMTLWMLDANLIPARVSNSVIDNTLALEAGAVKDVTQWSKKDISGRHFCSKTGSADYKVCEGNEHTFCSAGSQPSRANASACEKCEPGRYAPTDSRMNTCLVCPSGRYARGYGQSDCNECKIGRYWVSNATTPTDKNVTECTSCPLGKFSNEVGATQCQLCGEGSMAGKPGTFECERCPYGSYQASSGKSACTKCKEGMDTLFVGSLKESECVCPEGQYTPVSGTHCLPCREGMYCGVNSMEKNLISVASDPTLDLSTVGEFPRIQAGYYSETSAPFKVYLCKDDRSCPGNLPQTCDKNMHGIACGKCKAGYYRDGQSCYECTEIDKSSFNYPVVQIIVGPFVVLALYFVMRNSREDWGRWWNELCNVAFTLSVHYQILGLFAFTFLQYPVGLESIMVPFTYLVDLAAMLRLACSEYPSFHDALIVKITAPGLLLVIFLITYLIGFIMGKVIELMSKPAVPKDGDSPSPPTTSEGSGQFFNMFPLKGHLLFNLYCSLFLVFYVAICFVSLQLFMCYKHPTDEWSLLFAPEVLCWSDDWRGMMPESIVALLAYIVLPISLFAYAVAMAPTNFHKTTFHQMWKFLFIKFKPQCFWWGVFHMLRTLMLCLTLVFSQIGSRQVYLMLVMLLIYAAMLAIWWPWRQRTANLFDMFVTCCLIFFCTLSAPFTRRRPWLDDQLAETSVAVTISPIVVLVALLCYVAYRRFNPGTVSQREAKQLELVSNCRAVFTKFVGLCKDEQALKELRTEAQYPVSAEAFIQSLSAQDRDVLRSACSVIVGELLGHQPGKAGLPWRLVHQSKKSGARSWDPPSEASVSSTAS